MYCEKIKKEIKTKQDLVKDVNAKLVDAKLKWNYPEIKLLESKELLLSADVRQMTNIMKEISSHCQFDSAYVEITCDEHCKWFWDYLIAQGKIIEVKA